MKIVILTKKWGRNFSGATLATQYLVKCWIKESIDIEVYTLCCGETSENSSIEIHICKNNLELLTKLKTSDLKNTSDTIGYSDDHLGYIFSYVGIPYIHTYHGNWPDAKRVSFEMWLKSFYFIPKYKKTITNAKIVVNVSEYMRIFTDKYNKNCCIIRNGIELKNTGILNTHYYKKYLMVGNIDQRKYSLLIPVLNILKAIDSDIKIDIYGKVLDRNLYKKLEKYPNVKMLGEVKDIPYKNYLGLINTSKIENLPISACEAIKFGIPVFCFKVGGLPEIVITGETGYLFDCFDADTMAFALHNYPKGEKISKSKKLYSEFEWEYASAMYMELFKLLLIR